MSFKGKARPTFIRLVQVHAFITSYNELGILGRICQGGAAQCTSVCIQLYFRILLDGQRVALSKGRQEGSEKELKMAASRTVTKTIITT